MVKPVDCVSRLSAYVPTPQECWISDWDAKFDKLDWNEGLFFPEFLRKKARQIASDPRFFNWYPEYTAWELHRAIAKAYSLPVDSILSFAGSDVALDTACRAYLGIGDVALVIQPTYDNFDVFVKSAGATVRAIKLTPPFVFDVEGILAEARVIRPKLLYLVSPNNPIGYAIPLDILARICSEMPETLVIFDQAYVDFAPEFCAAQMALGLENLLVVRTFSKAFSLAGLRLGYVVGNRSILSVLGRIRNGKNISMMAQRLAVELLEHPKETHSYIQTICLLRQQCHARLQGLGVRVYESHGNFLFFEVERPQAALAHLKAARIYARDKISSAGGIRVTILDKRSVNRFLSSLADCIRAAAGTCRSGSEERQEQRVILPGKRRYNFADTSGC